MAVHDSHNLHITKHHVYDWSIIRQNSPPPLAVHHVNCLQQTQPSYRGEAGRPLSQTAQCRQLRSSFVGGPKQTASSHPIRSVRQVAGQARPSERGTAHTAQSQAGGKATQADRDPPFTVVHRRSRSRRLRSQQKSRSREQEHEVRRVQWWMWHPWPATAAQCPASDPHANSDKTTGWERGKGTETGAWITRSLHLCCCQYHRWQFLLWYSENLENNWRTRADKGRLLDRTGL